MKKYRLLPLAAAALLSVIACEKEKAEIQIVPSDDSAKVYASFSASGEDTKTILDFSDEVSNVKWEDTDRVAVFDGTAKNEFTVKAGTNTGAEAVFEGTVTDGATLLYAVYPSSAAESLNSGVLRLTVPAEQHIASGACADYSALVSVGSAERNQPVSFKQVCGLLKITISSADVQEIRLVGEGLAGKADVAASGELQSVVDPSDEIVLTHEEGLFPIGTFYAAVLPGTSPAGTFSIKLVKIGRTGTKTASSAVTFQRRKGIDAGLLNDLLYSVEIRTMAELFNWNATRGTDEINDVVIAADIDMEMEPWVPKDFKGTFDGRGHKLYNLNVQRTGNACFFNTVTGTMKDVTFGSSDGSSYDGSSAIIQDNPEDDGEAWHYAGLVTRLGTNTELSNVVSYVPVTVATTSKSKTRVGGLVAVVASTSENVCLKNCESHGEVSILADAPAAAGAAGGIVGWSDTKISCSNVTNYGDITIKNSFVSYAAGILPCDNYGCTFDTCANSGNISVSGDGSRAMCVAGIVGDATDSNVKSCSNSGKIEISLDGEMKVGGIVGRAYLGCTVTDCTNSSTAVIVSNPEGATKRTFLGGIVGNSPAANNTELTIENCKNYASFSTENAQVASVSGIAGYLNGAGKVTIRGCENYGDMSNENAAAKNGTSAAAAYVSGIVAYMSTSMLDGSCVEGCINRGAIFSKNRNINYIGAILPILKASTAVSVKDCHNYGTVTREVDIRTQVDSNNDTYYSVGGIIGKVDGVNAEVSGCVNHSSAAVWANAGGGSAYPKVGGVIAYIVKAKSVSGCRNEASVTYDNTATGGSFGVFGGVIGHAYATQLISDCYNSGSVFSNRSQVNRTGGIVGTLNNSSITGCTNEGTVTISSSAENWQAAGGIIGFAEGSGEDEKDIVGNVNTGAVSISVNTNNARCCVGGILGMPVSSFNISDNVNRGSVSGNNAHASAPYCYVGGIIGQDKGATSVSTISGNKSYGEVKNETGNASYSAAGGLVGNCDVSGMSGSVFCSVSGTNSGAVAGVNSKAITATLCDAVKVNGVTKASAADEAVWLCPSNTGTITPTYVAHSSGE